MGGIEGSASAVGALVVVLDDFIGGTNVRVNADDVMRALGNSARPGREPLRSMRVAGGASAAG